MNAQFKYEDVEQYLRTFPTNDPPYFGGLIRLVLAGIENLRRNASDSDVIENAHSITQEQAAFLRTLLDARPESIEWYKDHVGHSSQTGLL